jgi:hypothetical protein
LSLLLAHHVSAPTPRLPEAHAALQAVVDRLMAKKPADRYASAQDFLLEFAEGALSRTLVHRPRAA